MSNDNKYSFKDIETYFNDRYKEKYKILCNIYAKQVTVTANSGFGVRQTNTKSLWYLSFLSVFVNPGLPCFSINSKVFARNFILAPFRILGLAHHKVKTGYEEIDKKLDIYFGRKHDKKNTVRIFRFLFEGNFKIYLENLVLAEFEGSIKYNSDKLIFETFKIPENESQLNKLQYVIEFMKILREKINELPTRIS